MTEQKRVRIKVMRRVIRVNDGNREEVVEFMEMLSEGMARERYGGGRVKRVKAGEKVDVTRNDWIELA